MISGYWFGEFAAGFLKKVGLSGISGLFNWKNTISALARRKDWRPSDAHILFIDDEDVAHIEGLKKAGYLNTEYWKDIDNSDSNLAKLFSENFDIIFLDIIGVGEKFHQDGAIGILRNIKDYNPSIIVILYSSASHKMDKHLAFKLADDHLTKDVNIGDVIERIRSYMDERHTLNFYWEKIVAECKKSGLEIEQITEIEHLLVRGIKKQQSPTYFIKRVDAIAGADLKSLERTKIKNIAEELFRRFI